MDPIEVTLSRANRIKTITVNDITLTGFNQIHEANDAMFVIEFTNDTTLWIEYETRTLSVLRSSTEEVLFRRPTNLPFLRRLAQLIARPVRGVGATFPRHETMLNYQDANTNVSEVEYLSNANYRSNALSIANSKRNRRTRRTRRRR